MLCKTQCSGEQHKFHFYIPIMPGALPTHKQKYVLLCSLNIKQAAYLEKKKSISGVVWPTDLSVYFGKEFLKGKNFHLLC